MIAFSSSLSFLCRLVNFLWQLKKSHYVSERLIQYSSFKIHILSFISCLIAISAYSQSSFDKQTLSNAGEKSSNSSFSFTWTLGELSVGTISGTNTSILQGFAPTSVSAPATPVATSASDPGQTSFTANWNSSIGATGYRLDVVIDNGFTSILSSYNNIDVSNVTSYSITGLNANTDYYYRIRAYNTGGTSESSDTISVTTLPNSPLAPLATAASNVVQTSFTANWNASVNATGYRIDVATDEGFTAILTEYNNLDLNNVITYSISGLTENTSYYYRVRAYNDGGTSGNSDTVTTKTLSVLPLAPVAIAATNPGQTDFTSNWNISSGAIGYRIDVATDDGFNSILSTFNDLDVHNVLTLDITGLNDNTSYYYRVRAYNSGGTSSSSNTITAATLPIQPLAPIATAASNVIQTSFTANWNSSEGATGYWLDVATDSGFTSFLAGFHDLDMSNVLFATISGLDANTPYYYRLRAYNTGGLSIYSDTIPVATLFNPPPPPLAPVVDSASNIQLTSFLAKWKNSSTASGYILWAATDMGFTTILTGYDSLDVSNVLKYDITSLTSNTNYYYRLKAYNAGGISGYSEIIPVKTLLTLPSPPSPPLADSSTSLLLTSFTANWESSASATGYFLDVTTDIGFSSILPTYDSLDVSYVLSYNITGLTSNTTYYYRIRAYNAGGMSASSNTIPVKTLLSLPSPPIVPIADSASNILDTGFTANWRISANATGYFIDVAADNHFDSIIPGFKNLDVYNVLSFDVTGLNANSLYYYRVRAYNAGGTSESSDTIPVTTLLSLPSPPIAPIADSASIIMNTGFTANWRSSANSTGYYLDLAADNHFDSIIPGFKNLDVYNVLSFDVTGLNVNSLYYYRVRAYNAGGTSESSDTIPVKTLLSLPSPPIVPIADSASNILDTCFTANWRISANAIGYYLDVATDNHFDSIIPGYKNLDVNNVLSYGVTVLYANSRYYYRVRAYNTRGTSESSDTIPVKTLLRLPSHPIAPIANSASNVQYTNFTANWRSSSNATGYYLDVAIDIDFVSILIGYNNKNTGTDTFCYVTGLIANTEYYYRVRAYNVGGTSSGSDTIPVKTLPNPPAAPVANDASAITQISFKANWESSANATGYIIAVATDTGFSNLLPNYNRLDVKNNLSLDITGLSLNTVYYYRVAAYNTGGQSLYSNIIKLKTKSILPSTPTGLIAKSCNDSITISWRRNRDLDFNHYRLYGGTSANPTEIIDSSLNLSTDTLKVIIGLTKGQIFYFRVTVVNTAGVSSLYSNQCSVTVIQGVIPKIKSKWNEVLICYNPGDSIRNFQWFNDNISLQNDTEQFYWTQQVPGKYKVLTVDQHGCRNFSNEITLSNNKSLSLFPNPATSGFVIRFNDESTGRTLVTLFNSSGIKVLEYQTEKSDDQFYFEVPIHSLEDGLYEVEIIVNNENIYYSKIIVKK